MKLIIVIGLAVLDIPMLLTVLCKLLFRLKEEEHTIGQRVLKATDLRLRLLCQMLVRNFVISTVASLKLTFLNVNSSICALTKASSVLLKRKLKTSVTKTTSTERFCL